MGSTPIRLFIVRMWCNGNMGALGAFAVGSIPIILMPYCIAVRCSSVVRAAAWKAVSAVVRFYLPAGVVLRGLASLMVKYSTSNRRDKGSSPLWDLVACNLSGRILVLHIKNTGSIPVRSIALCSNMWQKGYCGSLESCYHFDLWVRVPPCALFS